MIISPTQAAGKRLRRAPKPLTEITNKFFAPVLSAQLITAPTGKPSEIRNLPPPTPPRPLLADMMFVFVYLEKKQNKTNSRVKILISVVKKETFSDNKQTILAKNRLKV